MTKTELIKKLTDIEWEDFEVKESKSELPKNIWETVSAFSNTAGGWIVLGVKQKGKTFEIVGVSNPEKLEQDFTNTLRGEKFNAKILPNCKKYQFEEKVVLAFYIPVSGKKPIYYNSLANTFLRTASGDQHASKEEIDAMYRDQAFGTRSSETANEFTSADLDMSSVKEFRSYLGRIDPSHPYNKLADDTFLKKVRVIDNGNLTFAGLFFLGSNDAIQKAVPDFRIDYLEIPGTSYSDSSVRYSYRLDEQENLWQYFFVIMRRLHNAIDLPFQMDSEGFGREDQPQLDALREALVNMLIMPIILVL